MNSDPESTAFPLEPPPSPGLAIASLVLGILAVALSFLLVGGMLGLLGLIIGPLAISYFFELIQMYRAEYLDDEEAAEEIAASSGSSSSKTDRPESPAR